MYISRDMAWQLIRNDQWGISMATKAIVYQRQSSGQYLIERAFTVLKPPRESGWYIQLHWISAHTGLLGNEEADKVVKEAARRRPRQSYTPPSEEVEYPDCLHPQTAAINTVVRDAIKKKWISLAKRNKRIPRTSIQAGTNEEGSYTA